MSETKTELKTVPLPGWFIDELSVPFRAGISSMFIIHGDINGLVQNPASPEEYISIRKFLEAVFERRKFVIFYNIASGLRFLTPEMEASFKKLSGLDSPDAAGSDPVAAAKANLKAQRGIPKEPETCFPLVEKALKEVNGVALIVQSAHFIAPGSNVGGALPFNERANIERLRNWSQSDKIKANGNIIVLLTDQVAKISSELRQNGGEIKTIFIPRPSPEERKRFIETLTAGNNELKSWKESREKLAASLKRASKPGKKAELEAEIDLCNQEIEARSNIYAVSDDFDLDTFTRATQGMNLRQIFEIFLQAKKVGKQVGLEYAKSKKKEILNGEYGDIMEVMEPERGLEDIGGMEHIKEYFRNVLDAIRKGEDRLVPMGVTLMGPPGTGKTAIVEALAREAGFNFVKTKNIRSMWVGESEARMEKLVYALRSLAPVVVMNDEADLNDADRNSPKGDSGVSERIMKMWMELLSDPRIRGKIIVISCTNRPDRIDPALKRSGRSDERILVPMPSKAERIVIFPVMFKRHQVKTSISDFSVYAEKTVGFSGADIEKIVLNSCRFAFEGGQEVVSDKFLDEAIADFIPSANQAEIDRMTLMGIMECSSRRLLPPNVAEIIAKITQRNLVDDLPDYLAQIEARKIVEA